MENRNIIVIGASAGGFEAIKQLLVNLPADLNASIFIVWHISPDVRGVMPQVLNKLQKMPAAHAVDKEPIRMGHIYVAPPDHHLLLDKGLVRVTKGPKENRFRPAVDPLFRSAALAYGPRVIGIVLSGALDDGTAGLWTIKQQGGLAIVQDPTDAEVPSMPENALSAVKIDYKVPVTEMGALLQKLVQETAPLNNVANMEVDKEQVIRKEISIAMDKEQLNHDILSYGELSPFTCPECHGVLTMLKEGGRVRFRCHTGHAFSADSLLATITENIEQSLWNAIRSVQESVMLLNHMGDHFAEINQPKLAAMYFRKAKEAHKRGEIVRGAVKDHEQLSVDSIQQQADEEGD